MDTAHNTITPLYNEEFHYNEAKTAQRAHTLKPDFPAAFSSKLPHEQDSLTISYVGSQHCTAPSETHTVTECDMPP